MDEQLLGQCGITLDTEKYSIPILEVKNSHASAKISLWGGQILTYTPAGCQPVLWMSGKSYLETGKAIRGGVPICWPWFGPSPVEGRQGHGFVRTSMWHLISAVKLAGDRTLVVMGIDQNDVDEEFAAEPFRLELAVTVGTSLEIQLRASNTGSAAVNWQSALHTYFSVGDVEKVSVIGLDKATYLDKAPAHAGEHRTQFGDLEVDQEIDRVFYPTDSTVKISDPVWRRTVYVEKSGSLSTVVWNPWINKSKAMADFGDNEYHRMICVETANAFEDTRTLQPGETTVITQKVSVEKWD